MRRPSLTRLEWEILLLFLLFVASLYWSFACAVFQWRNPTANKMQLLRELPAVLRLERLDRYQVVGPRPGSR